MSFSDLLNQPLPSSVVENEVMEGASGLANVPGEVATLFKDYRKSIKDIKHEISSVRKLISDNKFNQASTIIKKLYKKIDDDWDNISKQVKYIEADGLDSNTIKKITFSVAVDQLVVRQLINRAAVKHLGKKALNVEKDKGEDAAMNKAVQYGKGLRTANTAANIGEAALYVAIKKFVTIKRNYASYYMDLKNTVETLEKRCKEKSRNIKECLIDFIMLTQDMEMLMESVEESEYMESESYSDLQQKFVGLLNECDHKLSTATSGSSVGAFIEDEKSLFVSFIKSAENFNPDDGAENLDSNKIMHSYKICMNYLKKAITHCSSIAKKQNDTKSYNKLIEEKALIDEEIQNIIDSENIDTDDAISSLNEFATVIKNIASKISDSNISESTNLRKAEKNMSFSDLLNQPLPSKLYLESDDDEGDTYIDEELMSDDSNDSKSTKPANTEECGDNCKGGCGDPEDVTESVDLKDKKKIKQAVKDISSLSKAYQRSTKEIRESIKGIRIQIGMKKFNGALNMINTCRKKVLDDRKEIEKQINSIKSAGFDLESIKKAEKEVTKKSAGKILGTAGATAAGVTALDKLTKDASYVHHSAEGRRNARDMASVAALGVMAAGAVAGEIVAMGPAKFRNLYKLLKKVVDSYDEYYNTVLATLDSLENKCENQSQNIKECLVDYITLTNSIEMLMESADDDDEDDINDDEEEDEDDIDISDMSDADLDELEEELADSDVEDAVDDVEEVDLTPEEEREADDFMSLAATTELVRDELSATERAEFYSDPVQAQIAVVEGFMLESDFADGQMVTEKFFNKTRVQFSKEDRKHQLFAVALNASARAHNDPDYIKLQKVQQMRRVLKARIRKKYRGEALRRVKVYMQRLKASKSGVLAKIGEKLHKDNKD